MHHFVLVSSSEINSRTTDFVNLLPSNERTNGKSQRNLNGHFHKVDYLWLFIKSIFHSFHLHAHNANDTINAIELERQTETRLKHIE